MLWDWRKSNHLQYFHPIEIDSFSGYFLNFFSHQEYHWMNQISTTHHFAFALSRSCIRPRSRPLSVVPVDVHILPGVQSETSQIFAIIFVLQKFDFNILFTIIWMTTYAFVKHLRWEHIGQENCTILKTTNKRRSVHYLNLQLVFCWELRMMHSVWSMKS